MPTALIYEARWWPGQLRSGGAANSFGDTVYVTRLSIKGRLALICDVMFSKRGFRGEEELELWTCNCHFIARTQKPALHYGLFCLRSRCFQWGFQDMHDQLPKTTSDDGPFILRKIQLHHNQAAACDVLGYYIFALGVFLSCTCRVSKGDLPSTGWLHFLFFLFYLNIILLILFIHLIYSILFYLLYILFILFYFICYLFY